MSSRRIGFDQAVLDFLADRIASAIDAAFCDLRPARWGWAKSSEKGLSRNRSLRALQLNRDLPDELREQMARAEGDLSEAAVDRQLSVLRVEQQIEGKYEPRAALAIFGLHPTVIDAHNALYGGDVFGYATRALESRLRKETEREVLVAMANGIEGDVTAIRRTSTPAEARRIGAALADRIYPRWKDLGEHEGQALDEHAVVHSRYRDLDLPKARVGENGGRLCPTPEIGTPLGGGADDHPTYWRVLDSFNPGVKRSVERHDCQSPKYILQGLGASVPGESFPRIVPIAIASLGNGVLVTLPAEVTTVVGLRARESVSKLALAANPNLKLVAVVGLTNEYIDYVASADEYRAQRYEGASTLYGPWTGQFLREQAECLAHALWGGAGGNACDRGQPHPLGEVVVVEYPRSFFRAAWLDHVPQRAAGSLELTAPHSGYTPDGALALHTELHGVAPSDVKDPRKLELQLFDGKTLIANEQGMDLRARWDDDQRLWLVSWTPEDRSLCQHTLHFRVVTAQAEKDSPTAKFDCLTSRAAP
jgi:neutral ceramidase